MLIRVGYEIIFSTSKPVPMLLLLSTHPSRSGHLRQPDCLTIEPICPREVILDSFGNWCTRVVAPAGRVRFFNDTVVEDFGEPDAVCPGAVQHAVEDLPADTLPYLLASRYCEVDRLCEVAWQLFGGKRPGWPLVQAVCDWVHANVRFDYASARPTKTAYDVFTERVGVCRDFTHLAITFCRCLNIPARYATGYLGDIGVPLAEAPMDFSAWFEVFLGGRWHTFDARHNTPRIGRILMARGRDAVDAALATSFGPNVLEKFTVWTIEVASTDLTMPPV
jgi:transglutaminase-like putative cysteine protease